MWGGGRVVGGGGRRQFHAGIAQWLERRTRDRKVAGSSAGKSGGKISVPSPCYRSSTSKDLRHSAKSASGRFHLNTQSPYVCSFE